MSVPNRDIDKLLETTMHMDEEDKTCFLLFEIDIDRLLECTQDW